MVYEPIVSVIEQNWHVCQTTFPRIVNENTNNRIESHLKMIKDFTSIYQAIINLTSWAEDMISTGLTKAKKIQTKNF